MKVILQEEVENLGDMGDLVDVTAGYGRNYLIPKGLAVRASKRNVKSVEHEKRIQTQRLAKRKGSAEDFSEKLGKLSLRFVRRVGEGDRLFGSVTAKDIADAIQEAGEKVDRRKIQLESPIKAMGVVQDSGSRPPGSHGGIERLGGRRGRPTGGFRARGDCIGTGGDCNRAGRWRSG